ncbi:MAG: putative toxin-antitoxin system toxin component, PIN family [Candidatus Omnitrophota bacterium]
MFKVVLDTNQFVSGLISKEGAPAKILNAWREHTFILICSYEILEEIKQTLQYPHITKKYNLSEENTISLISLIEHEAIMIPETAKINVIKGDPDDDKIIACAVGAEADYIVSGDKHLLSLREYKNIPIIPAAEFLRIIK